MPKACREPIGALPHRYRAADDPPRGTARTLPLAAWRARCANAAETVAPLVALHAIAPGAVAAAATGLGCESPQEGLAYRVVAQLRTLDIVLLPSNRDLTTLARKAARRNVEPLHKRALPLVSPGWTWYETIVDDAPPWPEMMLHAAASHDLESYDAALDLAEGDERVDEETTHTIDALNRRSWESSVKNSGNFFWSDQDRVAGRMPCPADIKAAITSDIAGAFGDEGLGGVPTYIAYIAADTGNVYLDVVAEHWADHVAEAFAWSPGVAVRAREVWRAAHDALDGYRDIRATLDDPHTWPAFLRAYGATLNWCFGPGMRAIA